MVRHRQPAVAQQGAGTAHRPDRGELRPSGCGDALAQRVPPGDRARTGRRRLGRPRDRPDRVAGRARRGRPGRGRRRSPAHRRAPRGAAAAAQRAGRRRPPRQPGSPAGRAVRCRAATGRPGAVGGPLVRRAALQHSTGQRVGRRRHPAGVRAAGRRARRDVRVRCPRRARQAVRRVPVLHPELRQARLGRRRRLADRARRRGPVGAARLPRARRLVLPPSIRPGHAGRAALHARDGRARRWRGVVHGRRRPARTRPTEPCLAPARRAHHEGTHLRPGSRRPDVHGPAHG